MRKRVFAFLLSLMLLLSLMPVAAPRAEATAITADQTLEQRRQAAFDYMMSMATVMWRATEDITYTYGTSTAPIVAGRLYRGIPYTHARGDLATFMDFAGEPDEKGVVELSGLNVEHLDGSGRHARIGNDCSGAINAAYGSIGASVNICGSSTTVPDNGYLRVGYDKYAVKPSDSTNSNGKDVCVANGEQVMYSIYAEAQLADTWACSGHDMMNHYVTVVYNEDGTIDGEKSTATIVHQTPAPIRNESYYTSGTYSEANYGEKVYKTYEINISRTFKWLYDNGYVPVTCREFVDVNAVPADVTLTDTVSDYNFHTITEGVLTSNRMIDSVTLTITDTEGTVLQQATSYSNRYTEETTNLPLAFDMFQFEYESPEKMKGFVNLNQLAVGSYHCTTTARLRTGEILTARDFDFTVTEDDLCTGWVDNSNLTSTEGQCPVCKEAVTWQPLPQITAATSLEVGHYYLESDLNNASYYNFKGGNFCVHLNGHDLNSSSMAIRLGSATVNVLGNGKVTGSYSDATSKYGSTVYLQSASAKLHLYGGQYGHNADTTQATIGMNIKGASVAMYAGATICRMNGAKGPQVYVAKGTFEMFGGLIADGDNRKNYGGNVKVGDDNGETANFIMHDGIIAYGNAKHGGNIHLDGATTSFIQKGGLIYLGMAGYITNDGAGGNIYMDLGGTAQLDGTVTYGKSYAGGGNLYLKSATVSIGGTVEKANGDYGGATGKSGGNVWIGNGTQLTITGTVRDHLSQVSYGGNIFCSASHIVVDGGTVSGGNVSSRGGNIYMTASNGTLLIKNNGVVKNGSAVNGGNIATNNATTVITVEKGSITGGTATTGPNIRLHAAAKVILADALVGGGIYAANGIVCLKNQAQTGSILFTTGDLQVDNSWEGTAGVQWTSAYTYGDTVAASDGQCGAGDDTFTAGGSYTGILVYEGLDTMPQIFGKDGTLTLATTQVMGSGTAQWAPDNASAVAQVAQDGYIKLYTAQELALGDKNVCVDFNGQTGVKVTTGAGSLCGMDSSATAQTAGTATAIVEGNVTTDAVAPNGKRYIAITDAGTTTFHLLEMGISGVSLRPGIAGIYYRGTWQCDPVLASRIESFGVAVSLVDMPQNNFKTEDTDTMWTVFGRDEYVPGQEMTGVMIQNILRQDTQNANARRAKSPVFAATYITFTDGTTCVSHEAVSYSLYNILQTVQSDMESYGSYAAALEAFCEEWNQYGAELTFDFQ